MPALADWIMLSNGDRLSGTITAQDTNNVSINTEFGGDMTIPRTKIASIHQGQAPRILARELRTGVPMSQVVIAEPEAKVAPTPDETAEESDERQAGVYEWEGRMSAGGSLQDGNSSSKNVTADANVKLRDLKNRFGFGGEVNWAEDDGEETDNDQQIYGTYDRFITDKWFLGVRQSFERDKFEDLDLRSQSGIFAGYQFYDRDDLHLQVEAGPDYIYEKFTNGDTEGDIALSWLLDYDQDIWKDKLVIYHNHEISAPFADYSAFLFESESGLRVPISERLDAEFEIDFDWDNDPEPGITENDTTYAVKLGYGW